jgi:hypothetical protein
LLTPLSRSPPDRRPPRAAPGRNKRRGPLSQP